MIIYRLDETTHQIGLLSQKSKKQILINFSDCEVIHIFIHKDLIFL